MKHLDPACHISVLCGLFGKSRQAYYQQASAKRAQDLEADIILQEVSKVRQLLPATGVGKLLEHIRPELVHHGIRVGRDQLYRLLRERGLLIKRRRRGPAGTDSKNNFCHYPNLTTGFEPAAPNTLWVCDITYIRVASGFCYLHLVTDAYSHRVNGFCLDDLSADTSLKALEMALGQWENRMRPLIHHSDRGSQYASAKYTGLLAKNQVRISMSQRGAKCENQTAERLNGILKGELGLDQTFPDTVTANQYVAQAIWKYNSVRLHDSCGRITPDQAHLLEGKLTRKWKNGRRKKSFPRHDETPNE